MQNQQTGMTVTIHNPTPAQLEWLTKKFSSPQDTDEETTTTKKRSRPAKTVSDDEDKEFATKGSMTDDDLSDDDAPEQSEDEETDEDEEEDETDGLSFDEVKSAINKYGEKHPDEMKAILLGFNIKTTKELKMVQKKWGPVYTKVMAKLKKMKK